MVYSQKENIFTFDGKGELLLTIMSSLAQEESRSISENTTWGQRKRFSDGKVSLAYSTFLGYTKGPDDDHPLVIVEEEAKIVRRIYREFLYGSTPGGIAKGLTKDGVPTPAGKAKWSDSTVASILANEKYKGDALLQKKFTVDFLTKKLKLNEGEVPQYYISKSHEAIIAEEEWDAVQQELERRKKIGSCYSGHSVFSSRIVCGDCGSFLVPKQWDCGSKYKRTVWICKTKRRGGSTCKTTHLTEDEIKEKFLDAFNQVYNCREQLIEDCGMLIEQLTNRTEQEKKIQEILAEIEIVNGLIQNAVKRTVDGVQGAQLTTIEQHLPDLQLSTLDARLDSLQARLQAEQAASEHKRITANGLKAFRRELQRRDKPVTEFDDLLFLTVIEKATFYRDGRLVFQFKNGMVVEG